MFDAPCVPVYVRVAGDKQQVAIDAGLPDRNIISIKSKGWNVAVETAYRFVRGAGFGQLSAPARGGKLEVLQMFLGLDDQNYRLLAAFLINALKPTGPYFILLVEGEQGSGKSFFCEIIKRIIDPNQAMRLRLPDKPQDLMIQAKEYRLLNFDNASGMSAEMSDSLCSLATGGGLAVRRLYSDGDLYVMSYSRPFVINGIGGYANRPILWNEPFQSSCRQCQRADAKQKRSSWQNLNKCCQEFLVRFTKPSLTRFVLLMIPNRPVICVWRMLPGGSKRRKVA
ncbi:hypothetical protein CEV33_3874 [Brucella grignonensis]|uniref:Uncharacterized protein n=1 Tax=Brucella grignonensis TaxID=94627 RepID=A0A256FRE4_9HYPH|nr:hypothetical protein CEV33_3874 [Brucella grignonensis]